MSPVTESWALFHYVQQASKLNNLTEEKEGKEKASCRGDREQLGGKGTEEKQVLKLR